MRMERSVSADLVLAYGDAWKRIRASLNALLKEMDRARDVNGELSVSWLFRLERMARLEAQVLAEIGRFGNVAEARITTAQLAAAQVAAAHARDLIATAMGPRPAVLPAFMQLSTPSVVSMVGVLQPGSPLRALLDALGPEAAKMVRKRLIAGVVLGQSPRLIARNIRAGLGGNLTRALTVARTEVLRSYREGNRQTFRENRDVVTGWTWQATLDSRTCAFCWAMHGTEHPLNAPMATHPNCRCVQVPITKSWRDLGYDIDEVRPPIETGVEQFARLPESEQRQILGPAKYRAYAAGAIDLKDIPGFRRSAAWGRVGFERSLTDILGERKAKRYIRAA